MNSFIRVGFWIVGIIIGAAIVNFAPMLSIKTPEMERYRTDEITFWAEPKDRKELDIIAAALNESKDRVALLLGSDNNKSIEVLVYPDGAALKRKTLGFAGMLLPSWYIGKNTENHVMIVSPANPGKAHTRDSIIKASVHEYVHVLTDRMNRSMDYWLKEGFALYLAQQDPSMESLRDNIDITWNEFSNPNAVQFASVGGYSLAWAMMLYLEQEYGWEKTLGFLEPGSSFEDVTGKPKEQFFREWKLWLSDYTS